MSDAAAVELRADRRSNVFLTAVLAADGVSLPVRIRDLSPDGARVDGKDLPEKGGVVRLKRGPHSVVARVAWSDAGVCGLSFSAPVRVQEWISYATGHSGQQRVDEIVARVRSEGAADKAAGHSPQEAAVDPAEAADELERLSREIERIADSLSVIPAVIDQGLAGLQGLDLARQKLADLAVAMRRAG